ncbi:MAG: 3D domain-containing protein [Desulfopila sp.]
MVSSPVVARRRPLTRGHLLVVLLLLVLPGCAKHPVSRTMEVTAYCGCSSCCSWERGSWKYLKLNFWNRYVSAGPQAGQPYSGLTASGSKPREPQPGLFSQDTLSRPWMIPLRVWPWTILPEDGTIAADTRYYPFGTRMYVPDWGWGTVEDRGGAIKGRNRIDLYFDSHQQALHWGRRKVAVRIEYQ